MTFCPMFAGPGIAEADENCKKFMECTMSDCFNKVPDELCLGPRVIMLLIGYCVPLLRRCSVNCC